MTVFYPGGIIKPIQTCFGMVLPLALMLAPIQSPPMVFKPDSMFLRTLDTLIDTTKN